MNFLMPRDPALLAIGANGGCVRASSGYAFAFIQKQVQQIAQRLAKGQKITKTRIPIARSINGWTGCFLVFSKPIQRPRLNCFCGWARALTGDELAKFMSGFADVSIYAKLILAMPKRMFIRQIVPAGTTQNWTKGLVMLTPIDIFALIAVMLVGLPHGAFDGAIAFFLGAADLPANDRLCYRLQPIGGACMSGSGIWPRCQLWQVFLSLASFILVVAIFSLSDPGPSAWAGKALKMVRIFTHGGVVGIVLPSLHPQEVARLYAVLTGGDAGPIMDALKPAGCFLSGAPGLWCIFWLPILYRNLRGSGF